MLSVSVVIPVYNSFMLWDVLDSVLKQTREVKEVIIVDDASTDLNFLKILESVETHKFSVPVFIEKLKINSGPSKARNTGWDLATGDLVAFLDGDDFWVSEKIDRQVKFMEDHPEFELTGHLHDFQKGIPSQEIKFSNLLKTNPMATGSVVVQRTVPIRFDRELRYCEDHKFLIEVSCHHRVYLLGEVLIKLGRRPQTPGGLSDRKWEMRKGLMKTYCYFYRTGKISFFHMSALIFVSLMKHVYKVVLK